MGQRVLLLSVAALAAGLTASATIGQEQATATDPQSVALTTGPTALAVVESYVKVVGGVVAAVATVLGAPLTYQTFRKSRAEITKIELEAEKLKRDLRAQPASIEEQSDRHINVVVEGRQNSVTIATDPRLSLPMLVLIDVFIAYFYYTIVLFAIDATIGFLSYFVIAPVSLIAFLVIFRPVFKSARRVKNSIAAMTADTDTEAREGSEPIKLPKTHRSNEDD